MKGVRNQMKKFKQFFDEASAKDHVVPKDDDDEAKDYKPRSKGEKEFKDKHKVEKKKHPVADDSVHTGDIKKVKKEEVELEEDHDDKKDDHDSDDYEDDEEESDEVAEAVIDDLENIVKRKSMKKVKFANGKSMEIDLFTASAFVNMFKKVNKQNYKRGTEYINKSPENFMKMMDLAMGGGKK